MDAINCVPGLEPVMNPIEKVMTKRSTEFKVALAVAVLVVLLLATGSSVGSVWPIAVIVVVLWITFQQGLRYRHHRAP
jgi:dolichol kinase